MLVVPCLIFIPFVVSPPPPQTARASHIIFMPQRFYRIHGRANAYGVRLDRDTVLTSTRYFLGSGMFCVYGNFVFVCDGISEDDLHVNMVAWWRYVVVRYLHHVRPSGRGDLVAIALVVGWGDGGPGVGRGGDVRMRRGRNGKLGRVGWCGVQIYR